MMRASRLGLFTLLAVLSFSSTALAEAPFVDERTGFEVELSFGSSACVDDGESDCRSTITNLDTSYGWGLSAGSRWSPNMGLYLDLNEGELDLTGDVWLAGSTYGYAAIMPTFRYFFPFESADLWIGFGAGPSLHSFTDTLDDFELTRFNMLDTKIVVGAAFYLSQSLSLGLSIQNIFFVNGEGEACLTAGGQPKVCNDIPSDGEILDLLQVGVTLRNLF